MINPQKENGHIDIANEIAEALAKTQLSGYESRYLWVLWRKTYGWHKKDDIISNSQFVKLTGIKKQHIYRTEQRLIARNIVTKNGYKLQFNKIFTGWNEYPKMVTTKKVTKNGNLVTIFGNKVTKNGGHKRNYTKETITKEIIAPNGAEWNSNFYTEQLLKDKQRHIRIIGFYWKEKQYNFPTKKAAELELNRNLRPARELAEYPNEQITTAFNYVEQKWPDFTLETITKYIHPERQV